MKVNKFFETNEISPDMLDGIYNSTGCGRGHGFCMPAPNGEISNGFGSGCGGSHAGFGDGGGSAAGRVNCKGCSTDYRVPLYI